MPKLWDDTIESHRRAVRDATLDAAAALVAQGGLTSVTMSRIAETTGIGRATLYKYFPDVGSILAAWHQRQIDGHLRELAEVRDGLVDPAARLEAVLYAYALIQQRRTRQHRQEPHGAELSAFLHTDDQLTRARQQLLGMFRNLLLEAARAGEIRKDAPPDELARYCVHALNAASDLRSRAAARRLVDVTLAGLRPSG